MEIPGSYYFFPRRLRFGRDAKKSRDSPFGIDRNNSSARTGALSCTPLIYIRRPSKKYAAENLLRFILRSLPGYYGGGGDGGARSP